MDKLYTLIVVLGEKYKAEKIVLFGSRARGDNKERSDIIWPSMVCPKKIIHASGLMSRASHIYDDCVAAAIAENITKSFLFWRNFQNTSKKLIK